MTVTQHAIQIKQLPTDDDGDRFYEVDGVLYPSVTTILQVVAEPKLMNWYKKTSAGQIEKKRTEAADLGSRLHDLIGWDLMDPEKVVLEENEKDLFAVWRTLKEIHNIKATSVELPVIHRKFGFAGTMDVVGSFSVCPSDSCCNKKDLPFKEWVMDIKTGFFSMKAGVQLAAYRLAFLSMLKRKRHLGLAGIHVSRRDMKGRMIVFEHMDWCLKTFLCAFECWKATKYKKLDAMHWPFLHQSCVAIRKRIG